MASSTTITVPEDSIDAARSHKFGGGTRWKFDWADAFSGKSSAICSVFSLARVSGLIIERERLQCLR